MRRKSLSYYLLSLLVIGWIVVIATCLPQCSGKVNAQTRKPTKDSIPPQQKKYAFVEDVATNRYIDSVLILTLRVIGYELTVKQGDELRASLTAIINFRRQSANYQDSIYNSEIKKIKK
jgi:hypothetical protein